MVAKFKYLNEVAILNSDKNYSGFHSAIMSGLGSGLITGAALLSDTGDTKFSGIGAGTAAGVATLGSAAISNFKPSFIKSTLGGAALGGISSYLANQITDDIYPEASYRFDVGATAATSGLASGAIYGASKLIDKLDNSQNSQNYGKSSFKQFGVFNSQQEKPKFFKGIREDDYSNKTKEKLRSALEDIKNLNLSSKPY